MFPFIKKIWHGFLVFSLAILFSYFFLFLFFHPLNLVFFLGDKLSAATGITNSTSVPENPINQLAMQLDDKEKQLDAREQALNDQAAALQKQNGFWGNGLLWAILLAVGILAILVIINFYYDRRREKELEILAQLETRDALLKEEKNSD
jgi:hypothetical protein